MEGIQSAALRSKKVQAAAKKRVCKVRVEMKSRVFVRSGTVLEL